MTRVAAVNQDENVAQGSCVANYVPPWGRSAFSPHGQSDTIQVWMKPLADKSVAVALLNVSAAALLLVGFLIRTRSF